MGILVGMDRDGKERETVMALDVHVDSGVVATAAIVRPQEFAAMLSEIEAAISIVLGRKARVILKSVGAQDKTEEATSD